jgi:hypothetical protein
MDILAHRMNDLKLDLLVPETGKRHLGLVVAFPMTHQNNDESAKYMAKEFVNGAVCQGYKVLLLNHAGHRNQPTQMPKPTGPNELLSNVKIPWLDNPLAHESDENIAKITELIPDYDFIVLSNQGEPDNRRTIGLLDLDKCDPPAFADLTAIVDRFIFPCDSYIPEKMRSRTVTYIAPDYSSYISGYDYYASLIYKYQAVVAPDGSIIPDNEVSYDKGHVSKESYCAFLNFSPNGKYVSHETKIHVKYPELQPVTVALREHSAKIIFGALVGLIPDAFLYVDKNAYEYFENSGEYTDLIGINSGFASYAAINTASVSLIAADIVSISDGLLFSAGIGLVPTFIVGGIAHSLCRRKIARAKNVSKVLGRQRGTLAQKAPRPITATKDFAALSLSRSDSTQGEGEPESTNPRHTQERISATTMHKLYEQSVARYNDVRERWVDYELDIMKFLDAPLMRDLTHEPTAQFFTCMHRAQNLAEILNQEEDRDMESVRMFENLVAEMSLAFERAESAAVQTGADFLTAEKRKNFDKASKLLALANDESASLAERSSSLSQGKKMLGKSGVTAPAVVYGLLEGKIRMIEAPAQ